MREFNKILLPLLTLISVLTVSADGNPAPVPQKAWRGTKAAAAETAMFKPVFSGNSIICGNKTVQWDPAGRITVSNSGGKLLTVSLLYCYENSKKKIDWHTFTESECQVKVEDGKIVWKFKKKLGDKLCDAGYQTLEITPDGLLKVKCRIERLDVDDWKPRGKVGQVLFFLPYTRADGGKIILNNNPYKLDRKKTTIYSVWRDKKFTVTSYPDNPADTIIMNGVKPEVGEASSCFSAEFNKAFRFSLLLNNKKECTYTLDLRKGVVEKTSPDKRGGIDFQAIEKIELPDGSRRNQLQNSSFERGLTGYRVRHPGYRLWKGKWQYHPFEVVEDPTAPFGKHVLRFAARPNTSQEDKGSFQQFFYGVNITSQAMVMPEGDCTVSFYAKGVKGTSPELRCWVPPFHSGSHYGRLSSKSSIFCRPTDQWKRYSFTFKLPKPQPVELNFNALVHSKEPSWVWIDGVQLESGSKATPYEPAPAEGQLITSAPDNFISSKEKIDGRMVITTAKPNQSGKAMIRVRNFFGEDVLKRQFPFRTDASGRAEIKLPLDDLPGLGVFMLRADYELEDGSKAYEHHRYAKVDYLNNTHPNKTKFAFDYGPSPMPHFQFLSILDRWRKLGVGAKHHHSHNYDKKIRDIELSYGVVPTHASMLSYTLGPKRKRIGFGIVSDPYAEVVPGNPHVLVLDFYRDSDGTVTPEYLKKFKNAAKTLAAKNPHIPMWVMAGELLAKFPPEWWSKEKTPEACARIHAQLLKAFVDGVKEGNPKAKVFQDDPCNMRPDGGIAETELLLKECNKLGVRFDVIAIHPYRYSPESPDLDADTQVMLKMMDRTGYGKTPLFWPEMMHWGPFNIPQWGVISSTWGGIPRTWPGILFSYDMGATEKKSAAWYARSWLVVLKYGDRILGATAGNHINNCFMDIQMTPYAAQLVPNTLGNVLGDAKFKKDIRFAPFTRAYVFEDGKKRPVAAVWCHLDKVEDGYIDGPVAEADFGDSLESVIDFMNSPRSFTTGKYRFPVTAYPLFLRGKPGTLDKMIAALESANIVSGEGIAPLDVLSNPVNRKEVGIRVRNYLSRPFEGALNGKAMTVPASGATQVILPLNEALKDNAVTRISLPVTIKGKVGGEYNYDLSFEAFPAKKVPESATFETVAWSKIPSVPFARKQRNTKTSGSFRIGWNKLGVFIEAKVNDKTFVHREFAKTSDRWNNDCLQIYFDTMANARVRTFKGYDEDDYDYAVYPNSKGDSSIVFRARSVEQQLGLATAAPPDNTIAKDIPSSFSNRDGVLTYRVFFPAKYLLPIRLQKGWVFGFGLYAADVNKKDGKVEGALTLSSDNGGCFNKPHTWPAMILTE